MNKNRLNNRLLPPSQYSPGNSMSFVHPPSTQHRLRDYIIGLENAYAVPAKEFMRDSFQEYPLATSVMAIFAVASFTPIVASVALAVFTICAASAICFVTLLGLALCLSVILSSTLVSSVVVTTLAGGLLQLRHREISPADGSPPRHASHIPAKKAFSALFSPLKRGGWKLRALAVLIVWDLVSRIRLPRVVRYHPIVHAIFGRRRHTTLLRRIFSRTFAVRGAGLKLARLPLRLVGWKTILAASLVLFVLSPRLRIAARRASTRIALRVSAATGAGVLELLRSAPMAAVFAQPWKAHTATAISSSRQVAYTALAALVAFLRAQMDQLEDKSVAISPAEQPQPELDATYEMVSSVIPGGVVGSTAVSVSLSGDAAETLRERKVGEM
ncbi:hypothetical protein B0H17DRAFT_1081402, partial [Mycena rosella]